MYFDTSYLAKLYILEPGSFEVRQFAAKAAQLFCSSHGRVELAFMFHRKLREGVITRQQFIEFWNQVESDENSQFVSWIPLNTETFTEAVKTAINLPSTVFIRASDALHLICARLNGFREIYSNDQHLLNAAPHFELQGRNVIGISS